MNLKFRYLFFSLYFFIAGCGVKSDPLPPLTFPTPKILSASYTTDGENIILKWSGPSKSSYKNSRLDYYIIYRADYSKKSFCEKCPVSYKKHAEVSKNSYTEKIDTERYYFYQISVMADNGIESERSKTIKAGF